MVMTRIGSGSTLAPADTNHDWLLGCVHHPSIGRPVTFDPEGHRRVNRPLEILSGTNISSVSHKWAFTMWVAPPPAVNQSSCLTTTLKPSPLLESIDPLMMTLCNNNNNNIVSCFTSIACDAAPSVSGYSACVLLRHM